MILFTINPVPDGTVGSLDREIATGVYGGIAAVPLITTYARITQASVETLRAGDPYARITQASTEVLRGGDPYARITQISIEILRSTTIDASDSRKSSFFLVL